MIKVLYAVALCLGAVVIGNGCVAGESSVADQEIVIGGEVCGTKVCGASQFCCNESCSICAPIGGGCTQQFCDVAPDPDGDPAGQLVSTPEANLVIGPQQCGNVTCTGGTHCCNASCGTCVPPGGECTQQICQPAD